MFPPFQNAYIFEESVNFTQFQEVGSRLHWKTAKETASRIKLNYAKVQKEKEESARSHLIMEKKAKQKK